MDVDAITKILCSGDVNWELTGLAHTNTLKLAPLEAKEWYSLVTSRLDLGTHTSDVTLTRVKFVYATMTRLSIDIGCLIRSKIMQMVATIATGIWFPSLITTLCHQASVVIGEC